MKGSLRAIDFLDLIFPKTCEFCGKVGNYVCDKCYDEILKKYELNFCTKDKLFLFKYEGELRELLLKYKFRDKSYLRDFFADSINRKIINKKVYNFLNQYDIITPVPLHSKRKLERGYNQTEQVIKFALEKENKQQKATIQENVNKKLQIYYYKDILVKVKNIKPQSTKSGAERQENTRNAFKIKGQNAKEIIKEKNVLIFDDIYTTGSTFNECKKVLLENGAKKVGAFMIAKD